MNKNRKRNILNYDYGTINYINYIYIYVYIAQIKKQNHHEQIKKKTAQNQITES